MKLELILLYIIRPVCLQTTQLFSLHDLLTAFVLCSILLFSHKQQQKMITYLGESPRRGPRGVNCVQTLSVNDEHAHPAGDLSYAVDRLSTAK